MNYFLIGRSIHLHNNTLIPTRMWSNKPSYHTLTDNNTPTSLRVYNDPHWNMVKRANSGTIMDILGIIYHSIASFTHSLTHSVTSILIHSLTLLLSHSLLIHSTLSHTRLYYLLLLPLTHSFTSFTHLLSHSHTHSLTSYSLNLLRTLLIHLTAFSLLFSLILFFSLHPFINNAITQPPNHHDGDVYISGTRKSTYSRTHLHGSGVCDVCVGNCPSIGTQTNRTIVS